jgi:1,4-dihydroxy-2-naphthoate polyprenyltransferase
MTKIKEWIAAFRLRTLPLSISGVLMGSALAYKEHLFSLSVFILAITTTLFLQVLSNLANDYGDSKNGKDNENRLGPVRMVQSGKILMPQMLKMIAAFCLLSLVSGFMLIYISDIPVLSYSFLILFLLGLAAIYAAVTYTIGKNPYGYSGWGDVSVFIFFGLFSVLGTYFLFAHNISSDIALPAVSVGLFSVGVLNINNMRDYENDKATGKNTIVVKIGQARAKQYHFMLLTFAILSSFIYLIVNQFCIIECLFLISIVPLIFHLKRVFKNKEPQLLDNELKKLALIALLFTLMFGLSINI